MELSVTSISVKLVTGERDGFCLRIDLGMVRSGVTPNFVDAYVTAKSPGSDQIDHIPLNLERLMA